VTTSTSDNLAQHLVERSPTGVICEPSVEGVATAVQRLLADPPRPSVEEYEDCSWLSDYDWNFMADRVAEVYIRRLRRTRTARGEAPWNCR
jgi:hypothetical protein